MGAWSVNSLFSVLWVANDRITVWPPPHLLSCFLRCFPIMQCCLLPPWHWKEGPAKDHQYFHFQTLFWGAVVGRELLLSSNPSDWEKGLLSSWKSSALWAWKRKTWFYPDTREIEQDGWVTWAEREGKEAGRRKARNPEKQNTALGISQGQQTWEDMLPTYEESLVSSFMLSPTNQSLLFSQPLI